MEVIVGRKVRVLLVLLVGGERFTVFFFLSCDENYGVCVCLAGHRVRARAWPSSVPGGLGPYRLREGGGGHHGHRPGKFRLLF